MIAGHGLIAWPVTYGTTGVHSFVANQHGMIHETEFLPSTEAIVSHIERFNPDDS